MIFLFLPLEFRIHYLAHFYQGSYSTYLMCITPTHYAYSFPSLHSVLELLTSLYPYPQPVLLALSGFNLNVISLKRHFLSSQLEEPSWSLLLHFSLFTSQHILLCNCLLFVYILLDFLIKMKAEHRFFFSFEVTSVTQQCLQQTRWSKIFVEQNWPKLASSSLNKKVIKTVSDYSVGCVSVSLFIFIF